MWRGYHERLRYLSNLWKFKEKRREVVLERYEGFFFLMDNFSNGRISIKNIEEIRIIGRMISKFLIRNMLFSRIDKPLMSFTLLMDKLTRYAQDSSLADQQ